MTAKEAFWTGARNTLPLIMGAIPFGIVFGTLGPQSGLSFEATMGMSLMVFAGSAQFISLGLLMAGSPVWLIVMTTFVVNLRHLLYAVNLIPRVRHLPMGWRAGLAFGLTDESFAVMTQSDADRTGSHFHWYFLGSTLAMYSNWQLCTLLGLTLGEVIPGIQNWGLDVAMAVTFIGIVVPHVVNYPRLVAVLTAGAGSLALMSMPHQLGLIVAALLGIAAGMLCEAIKRPDVPVAANQSGGQIRE